MTPINLEDDQYFQDGFQDCAHFIKVKSEVGFVIQQINVVHFYIFMQLSVTMFQTNNFVLGY